MLVISAHANGILNQITTIAITITLAITIIRWAWKWKWVNRITKINRIKATEINIKRIKN